MFSFGPSKIEYYGVGTKSAQPTETKDVQKMALVTDSITTEKERGRPNLQKRKTPQRYGHRQMTGAQADGGEI